MILGISATRSEIVIAETKRVRDKFVIAAIRLIPFQVGSGDDLAKLLRTLSALIGHKQKGAVSVIALLKCSSGRFGSCLEAIKGEAMVELAAFQLGLCVVKVAPQSLKKALGCALDQKWRDRAKDLFNHGTQCQDWSKGAAGAIAVAFAIGGESPGSGNCQSATSSLSCPDASRLAPVLLNPRRRIRTRPKFPKTKGKKAGFGGFPRKVK